MIEGITLAVGDIAIMAHRINITDSIYEGRFVDFDSMLDVGQQVIFLQNLQSFMYNKDIPEQPDSVNYAAIKEFEALLPVQQNLTRKLAEFALIEMTA